MDKQELLNVFKNQIMKESKDVYGTPDTWIGGYEDGRIDALTFGYEMVEWLDEPEKVEKEELPSYIIKELEGLLPENEDLILYRFHKEYFKRKYGNEYFMSDKALNWFDISGNTTRLINAIRNGYKPYKEPVWVVKSAQGSGYLIDYELYADSEILNASKNNAYQFDDKQKAEAVATLVDGTVEDWSE